MFLPRQVLKWIHESDLTYSVRNPARDLSNGFTAAEIISRYFPDDISMHSFDPGTRRSTRESNWEQISKVLQRHHISSVTPDMITDVIHQKPGAAVLLMTNLFEQIASRGKPYMSVDFSQKLLPGYAEATAASRLKDPSIERTVDDDERRRKSMTTLLKHELRSRSRAR